MDNMLEFQLKFTSELVEAIADRVIERIKPKIIAAPKMDRILSIKQAAIKSGLSERTLRDHIRRGLLKGSKVGKSYLITEINLNNYITNGANIKK